MFQDRNGGSIEQVLQRPLLNDSRATSAASENSYGDVAQRQQQVDVVERFSLDSYFLSLGGRGAEVSLRNLEKYHCLERKN